MPAPPPAPDPRLWRGVTFAALLVGYTGYYVCRSVLSVASPLLVADPAAGVDAVRLGDLAAVGLYLYAAGKLVNGVAAEYLGGRALFLGGMIVSAACAAGFGMAAGPAAFALLWGANRVAQSAGWVSAARIAVRWFPPETLARVMGVLALSYLFGDALARVYLGAFIGTGVGWRELFLIAAGTLAALALAEAAVLRGSPRTVGLEEPPAPPGNLYGDADPDARVPVRELVGPLLASPAFWLVCGMNVGLTAVRETVAFWTPLMLRDEVGLSDAGSGMWSFVFPLAGAAAAVGSGWAVGWAGGRPGRVIVPLVAVGAVPLGLLAVLPLAGRPGTALGLVGLAGFFLLPPYAYCAGVLPLGLGGKRAGAAALGMIHAAGYGAGAAVAGSLAGRVVRDFGFPALFGLLFAATLATLVAAAAYLRVERRPVG